MMATGMGRESAQVVRKSMIRCGRDLLASYSNHNVEKERLFALVDQNRSSFYELCSRTAPGPDSNPVRIVNELVKFCRVSCFFPAGRLSVRQRRLC